MDIPPIDPGHVDTSSVASRTLARAQPLARIVAQAHCKESP